MRLILRSLLVSVLGLALGGASSAAAVSVVERNGGELAPGGFLLGAPLVAPPVDQLLDGQGSRAAREARRSSPVAVAERQAARSKYEGLTPARSASAARGAFPDLIEHPAGGAPRLPAGQRIVRYPTDHAAQVSLPGGQGVIESLAPIASKTRQGRHVPFDLRMRGAGGRFEPVRSDVGVDAPKDLSKGVSLPTVGVSLTPVDAHGSPLSASAGTLAGSAVLWSTSQNGAGGVRDLSTLAKALPDGFDLTTLLFSQRSPGELYFRVGMPSGAHLRRAENGAVQITRRGATLAVVSPVSATDAEGSNVPVSMRVDGDVLRLTVVSSGDYLYPIAVDPEVNDGQLAKTTAGKRSNWEFFTPYPTHFGKTETYEGPGAERLETKGIAEYEPGEQAYWGYETHGVSHIYEIKTETSAHNKLAKIESFLEFLEPPAKEGEPPVRETKKVLSNEAENTEYEKKATTACAANASKVEECLPGSGKAKNSVHFQQSAGGKPGANYKFSDSMSQGIVSIAEPTGTHSTTSYNTTTSEFEFETEVEGKKEKIKRKNALFGSSTWLSKYGGALELIAKDTGIGVAKTKLEYESAPGSWTQLYEHNYLEVENACQGVQCYETHSEFTTLPTLLPDGEQKIRYKAEEAMSGTQSLESEGQATVKVDSKAPHAIELEGVPYGNELSERPYELTGHATDGEGSTVPSSGVKSISLFIDGHEIGTPSGSCSAPKGACTGTAKWTVNGAELGAGHHAISIVALDSAGNEARVLETLSIRHSTPVGVGPGSVDLQSGDFALGANDVSLGSGLTVGRTYSSRAVEAGIEGPLGPQWSLSLATSESLVELVDGSVLLTDSKGRQSIFASLGSGKFEPPVGDSNLTLTLEEDAEKHKLAYYLENPAAHTKDKFTLPSGGTKVWVPTRQEGTVATDTLIYSYQTVEQHTDYPLPAGSHPNGITAGPDGNLWFVNTGGKTLGKITPAGVVSEYGIAGNELTGIALGPDEHLWVTESGSSKIKKFGTGGGLLSPGIATLPAGSHPTAIVPGPDGNLWFTNTGTNKIGKVTTGMVVTEYPAASPRGIAAGPDGNVWFTNYSGNKIGKMTTAGVVTEYALPAGSLPLNIVAGSDNNLWFTESGTNKIGKITTAGVVTEYALPGGSAPVAVTAGPDKNLWFTENGTSKIGKITTGGTVTEYATTSGSEAYGITTGPDGNMWFTKYGADKIGTMTTTGKVTEPSEVLGPAPAGVSCSPMKAGCRALKFEYASSTSATGENQGAWGNYQGRLMKVLLDAYNPSTKAMQETAVAEYSYDNLGRLRAEWDPRISPALKTAYGYDREGHLTALTPPGQETWVFTYGTVAGDQGTGRLVKVYRAAASESLWNGEVLKNTAAPAKTGRAFVGVRQAVSNGTWTGGPVSYAYQWETCEDNLGLTGDGCVLIPGANNPNYTPTNKDLHRNLAVLVTATNGGGSVTKSSPPYDKVQPRLITEYPLPSGSKPSGVTMGYDAKAWFTDAGTHKVGTTTLTGEPLTEYSSGTSGEPQAITSGSDHNLWFTKSSTEVGRLTTAGALTSFTLPANTYTSTGMTAGPDGNIWFTEAGPGVDKVAKMNTSGEVLAQYTAGSGPPNGIVTGTDGNLWVAQSAVGSGSGNSIDKYTPGGTKTSYALPVNSHPYGVTMGPENKLWFTEPGTDKVGKISTAGSFKAEYALPAGSEPRGIAWSVAENRVWVAERGTNKIAEMTIEGVVTKEYALPAGSQPETVAVESSETCQNFNSCVWVTEPGTSKILSLNPGVNESPPLEGEAKAPAPGTAIEHGVPLSGGSGLQSMTSTEVAKWGQTDVPVEASAIVAADEPQGWPASSYKRAMVYYLDEHGRAVNVATPSSATYGAVATTEYNEFNDPTRLLSADNRATALAAGAGSVEVSKLLDTQNTYNGEGKKESEVSEAGTRLIDVLGPQHTIKYVAGKEQKESLARYHKELFYDQGAPGGETYDLVTETSVLAQLANREEVEVRTTKTAYSGQSNLGWKLRAPTSVTVDPEGSKETTTTVYDEVTGEIKETRGAAAEHTLGFAKQFGTEILKLSGPWGIAKDAEGYVWVVDTGHSRIDRYTPAGAFNKAVSKAGSEPGQLKEPEGMTIDSSGDVWVADTGNNRVEEFSAAGTYLRTVGSLGSESGKFKSPAAVAFDSTGNLWVADAGNSRIEKFNSEGTFASEFGSLGSGSGQLKEPKGLTFDSGGHVWVSDTGNNRVQEFSTSGSVLGGFGSAGEGPGQLNGPTGLRFDGSGNLWVADTLNNRVDEFSSAGSYIRRVGSNGTEAGQLKEPRAVTVDAESNVWVSDGANNRGEEWSLGGASAHEHKAIYYSSAANSEGYAACGEHPEWAGLVCETLPAKQPELAGAPQLPVTKYTYNVWNEPETTTETFGSTTRTKTETYDEAGRRKTSETTATTGTALPKVTFEYSSTMGLLEKEKTAGEEKTVTSEYDRLGELVKYSDSDGNTAKYKYAGPENGYLLEEVSDSSNGGTSVQTYSYDSTTKLRMKLVDSAAGTFTASYDAEGKLASMAYPNNACALYTRNSVGEATSLKYLKTTNCSETEAPVWYSDSRASSVRGEMLSQTSTLASDTYGYDTLGRLTEAQETPTGEGCSVRAYAYDEESNRASLTSRTPGTGGKCQTEGGTVEGHVYDEANHLTDSGVAYDGLGNITKLPAADAEGHELTSGFYVDNAVASQAQNGVTNNYYLDPEGRVRETVTGSTKVISHYDGAGEAVAWTSESAEHWTRNVPGIDGTLAAVQTNGETPVLQLHDLQGNVVATLRDKAGETGLLSTYNSTEFGVPNAGKTPPKFAWLGAVGVESALASGVITYGATSYVPQTGRPLQSEEVEPPGLPGGSGAGAAYTAQEEAWNMLGAARAGAEAPGLEAARELAAMEAAISAAIAAGGEDPTYWLTRKQARELGAKYERIQDWAEVWDALFTIAGAAVHGVEKAIEDVVSSKVTLDVALEWFHKAGQKLEQCGNNHEFWVAICKFSVTSIHVLGVEFTNLLVVPGVEKCGDAIYYESHLARERWECRRLGE